MVTGFIMMQNELEDGDTPLHLACKHGNKSIVCSVITDYFQQEKSLKEL